MEVSKAGSAVGSDIASGSVECQHPEGSSDAGLEGGGGGGQPTAAEPRLQQRRLNTEL